MATTLSKKEWRKKQVLKELCFTIPFSPFPSILRAPCVASKSVMALETLSPVAASYSACQFRSIEVVVVVQVCTGACSKENPRCKATPNLSSLKVGSEGHCMSIQTGWLHMHECLQCGNDSSWKHCVLFIDAEDKVGWDFAAYQAWSTSIYYSIHHLPSSSSKKNLVKEMTPQTCFSVSVPTACCKKSCESQKLDWPNIPTKIQLFVAFSFAMAAASSECIPYLLLTRTIVDFDFCADPSPIVAKKFDIYLPYTQEYNYCIPLHLWSKEIPLLSQGCLPKPGTQHFNTPKHTNRSPLLWKEQLFGLSVSIACPWKSTYCINMNHFITVNMMLRKNEIKGPWQHD